LDTEKTTLNRGGSVGSENVELKSMDKENSRYSPLKKYATPSVMGVASALIKYEQKFASRNYFER